MPKKIKIKNKLPYLLSAVCNHKDCPEWLKNKIWDALNDNANIPSYTSGIFAETLKYTRVPFDLECDDSQFIKTNREDGND